MSSGSSSPCCENCRELVERGVQCQGVGEQHAGREVTARAAARPEGGVKAPLGHVVALALFLGIRQGDQPGERAPDPGRGERGQQRGDPLVDPTGSFGVEAGRVHVADHVERAPPPDPAGLYGVPEKGVPVDTVEDLADQGRAAAGSDPQQGGDFKTQVFGDRRGAVGTVVDELLRGLAEGVLIDSVVGHAQAMDGVELQGFGGDPRLPGRGQRVEQLPDVRGQGYCQLVFAGLVYVFDYIPKRSVGQGKYELFLGEVVGHAFSHGFNPDHVHRIVAYWAQAWGGPSVYTDTMSFATWSGAKGNMN